MDASPQAASGRGPLASRPAAVAGVFYPGSATALAAWVDDALVQARHVSPLRPKALIVPHAGYVYSGLVAASGYATLRGRTATIRRVVLCGPSHRVAIRGVALPEADCFETPLGTVPVDRDAVAALAELPQVVRSSAAHAQEHALEVQLPFLQRLLAQFTLVPLVVGDTTPDEIAQVLERVWGDDETLVVLSSDLSHYLGYDEARRVDAATARSIVALDTHLDEQQACGARPVAGLLAVARRRELRATLLKLCNSGDTAGDRRRVVGYGAFALSEPSEAALNAFDEERGRELLGIARASIREALGEEPRIRSAADWLGEHRATFVTLQQDGQLRGCVGSIEPRRPLHDDVAGNARAAALDDPRFAPVRREELERTIVEVSLLSNPEALDFADRDGLLGQLVVGSDGLVLSAGSKRATFLPQVWASVPDAEAFVMELKRKAGLAASFPIEQCRVERYRVRKWSEAEPRS